MQIALQSHRATSPHSYIAAKGSINRARKTAALRLWRRLEAASLRGCVDVATQLRGYMAMWRCAHVATSTRYKDTKGHGDRPQDLRWISPRSALDRPHIGTRSIPYRPQIGTRSALARPRIGPGSALDRPCIGSRSALDRVQSLIKSWE